MSGVLNGPSDGGPGDVTGGVRGRGTGVITAGLG